MKKKILLGTIFLSLAIIFTALVKVIDVQPIGPENSTVGFATINSFFKNTIGSNITLYNVAEILGYIPLIGAAIYGLIGFIQLVKRKSILKVDKEIIALGVFYIVNIALYFFFEKFIINYRPILIDGKLEASFPSSHTMIILCICASAIIINKKLFSENRIAKFTNWFAGILAVIIMISRFLSGAHWFTDIIGGLLFAFALTTLFYGVVSNLTQSNDR